MSKFQKKQEVSDPAEQGAKPGDDAEQDLKATGEPEVAQEPEQESKPEEGEPEGSQDSAAADSTEGQVSAPAEAGTPTLVEVESLAGSSLRQHSSGWVIRPKERRMMILDGWLENQIQHGLLKKV